jgi:hypothetical protein
MGLMDLLVVDENKIDAPKDSELPTSTPEYVSQHG